LYRESKNSTKKAILNAALSGEDFIEDVGARG
jgi:hypothetical protein